MHRLIDKSIKTCGQVCPLATWLGIRVGGWCKLRGPCENPALRSSVRVFLPCKKRASSCADTLVRGLFVLMYKLRATDTVCCD